MNLNLRPIDYILLAGLALVQAFLILQNKLLIGNTLLLVAGISYKLFNMYRLAPHEIERRNRGDGLAGLFC